MEFHQQVETLRWHATTGSVIASPRCAVQMSLTSLVQPGMAVDADLYPEPILIFNDLATSPFCP